MLLLGRCLLLLRLLLLLLVGVEATGVVRKTVGLVVLVGAVTAATPVVVSATVLVVAVIVRTAVIVATASVVAPTPGRSDTERFGVQFTLLSPISTLLLALRPLDRLARDVIEERLGLVVAHQIILFLLVVSGTGFVTRIILLLIHLFGVQLLGFCFIAHLEFGQLGSELLELAVGLLEVIVVLELEQVLRAVSTLR